jgi:hypothetical protein
VLTCLSFAVKHFSLRPTAPKLSRMNELTAYEPIRPAGAEPGEWRFTFREYNSTQTVVMCPKCKHGVIIPAQWDYRYSRTVAKAHCKGCGWHKEYSQTDDADDIKEFQDLVYELPPLSLTSKPRFRIRKFLLTFSSDLRCVHKMQ